MMLTQKRSPLAAIVLAVVIGLMVIALLNGFIRPTQVVVAKVPLAPGTLLTDQLVELRTIPMGARPANAAGTVDEVTGKMLAVGRVAGDLIVTSALGEIAGAGIPSQLPEGHVALAVRVDLASGVAGLLRPGQTVSLIGMLSPEILRESAATVLAAPIPAFMPSQPAPAEGGATATPIPTATPAPPATPLARLALSGLRILMVPQSFRYEELPAGATEEQLFSSARTHLSAQEGSVIVLDVPTVPVEVTPGLRIDPATLLAAMDQYGTLHLALEPAGGLALDGRDVLTLNLGELYQEMNDAR